MRPLDNFFHRRNIKDPEQWLSRMNIHDQHALETWCENNDVIAPEAGKYFPATQPEPQASTDKAVQDPAPKQSRELTSDPDVSWHTPAAERSRKATPKRSTTTKKKKAPAKKKS